MCASCFCVTWSRLHSALEVFQQYIEKRMNFPFFSNARTVSPGACGGVPVLCRGSIVMAASWSNGLECMVEGSVFFFLLGHRLLTLLLANRRRKRIRNRTPRGLRLFLTNVLRTTCLPRSMRRANAAGRPLEQVRNAMDRARMNSAIRVFNTAVIAEGDGGMVSEKVSWSTLTELFFVCPR